MNTTTTVTVTTAALRDFGGGYTRPVTPEQLRGELLNLMQGEAWRQLCSDHHPIATLLPEAAASLRDL